MRSQVKHVWLVTPCEHHSYDSKKYTAVAPYKKYKQLLLFDLEQQYELGEPRLALNLDSVSSWNGEIRHSWNWQR